MSQRDETLMTSSRPARVLNLGPRKLKDAERPTVEDHTHRPHGAAGRHDHRPGSRWPRRSCPWADRATRSGQVERRPDPSDPRDVEHFLDGLIPDQMRDGHVVGATVAVVKDGHLVFTKGYGFADLAPADAGGRGPHALLHRLGRQALHLDGGDATRRAGQARPPRRRQHLPGFHPSDALLGADHGGAPPDPYRRVRGSACRAPGRAG